MFQYYADGQWVVVGLGIGALMLSMGGALVRLHWPDDTDLKTGSTIVIALGLLLAIVGFFGVTTMSQSRERDSHARNQLQADYEMNGLTIIQLDTKAGKIGWRSATDECHTRLLRFDGHWKIIEETKRCEPLQR